MKLLRQLKRVCESSENWVYILLCADGTLYTGWTTDPEARLCAHNRGTGAKYTRTRRPVRMVYQERMPDKSAALRREYRIKHMRREEKLSLIAAYEANARIYKEQQL